MQCSHRRIVGALFILSFLSSMALGHGKGELHISTGSPHALRAFTARHRFLLLSVSPSPMVLSSPTCHKAFSSRSSTLFIPLYPVDLAFFLGLNVRNRSGAHHWVSVIHSLPSLSTDPTNPLIQVDLCTPGLVPLWRHNDYPPLFVFTLIH